MSVTLDRLLLLENATVNRNLGFDDVCNEKYVYIAYLKYEIPIVVSNMNILFLTHIIKT